MDDDEKRAGGSSQARWATRNAFAHIPEWVRKRQPERRGHIALVRSYDSDQIGMTVYLGRGKQMIEAGYFTISIEELKKLLAEGA